MITRRALAEFGLVGAAAAALVSCGVTSSEDDTPAVALDEIASSCEVEISALTGTPVKGLPPCGEPFGTVTRSSIARTADYTVAPLSDSLREILARRARYWNLAATERIGNLAPVWISGERASDYRHLRGFKETSDTGFELDARTLQFLAERNDFQYFPAQSLRLFGLRGCALEDEKGYSDWASTHRLRLATPDHVALNCLIGVWRIADNKIRLFRGSTVPQAANMYAVLASNGWGTSLLPTGFYRYRRGTHKNQPGALIIDEGSYVVLRTARKLSYDVFDSENVWTPGSGHNIHAAFSSDRDPRFDSAGCQVLEGSFSRDRRRVFGAWAEFRRSAGLVDADDRPLAAEAAGSGSYQYMLLTGLEAYLFYHDPSDFFENYRRLRPGSRGDRVLAEQSRLYSDIPALARGRQADTIFGVNMTFASLSEKKLLATEGDYTSPIISVRV